MSNLKFIFAVLVLFFGAAQAKAAVGPDSSWAEIRQAGLIAGFSSISFDSMGITVDELCVDQANLRPTQPYRQVCAKFDTRHDHFGCIEYKTVYQTTPIVHQEERCTDWVSRGDRGPICVKSDIVQVAYPLSYNVSVYKDKPRAGLVEVFTKGYSIPVCE